MYRMYARWLQSLETAYSTLDHREHRLGGSGLTGGRRNWGVIDDELDDPMMQGIDRYMGWVVGWAGYLPSTVPPRYGWRWARSRASSRLAQP